MQFSLLRCTMGPTGFSGRLDCISRYWYLIGIASIDFLNSGTLVFFVAKGVVSDWALFASERVGLFFALTKWLQLLLWTWGGVWVG